MFGLTNSEGNHGEDVKEYYSYLDSTPTHSYTKFVYKYPQAAFPYADLVETNRARSRFEPEYELLDTGVFDGDRYFDVFAEFAKETPEDLLVRITAYNRGPEAAVVRLRLSDAAPSALAEAYVGAQGDPFGDHFEGVFEKHRREADEFYDDLTPPALSEDARQVMRQALAGMMWSKQFYYFDLDKWLEEHGGHPLVGLKNPMCRNQQWFHMLNEDIVSMPDKWEYPWYAAWDLAFHTIAGELT